jgi:hypothetical protein
MKVRVLVQRAIIFRARFKILRLYSLVFGEEDHLQAFKTRMSHVTRRYPVR